MLKVGGARLSSALSAVASGRSKRRVLGSILVDTVGSGMFSSLLLLYLSTVNKIAPEVGGPLVTISAVLSFALMPSVSRVTHALGGRRAMMASSALSGVGFLLVFAAYRAVVVPFAALLIFVGDRLNGTAWPVLATEQFGRERLSFLFAVANSAKTIALGSGTLIAALALSVNSSTGLRLALAANVVSYLIGLFLLIGIPDNRFEAKKNPESIRVALRDRGFMRLVVSQTALSTSWIIPGVAFPLYLTDTLGEAPALAAALLTVRYTVISLCQVPLVHYAAEWSRRAVLAFSAASSALGVIAVFSLSVPSGALRVSLAVGATILLAGSEIVSKPTASALAVAHAPEGHEAPYMAVFQATWTLSYALGPAAIGLGLKYPPLLWSAILAIVVIGSLMGGIVGTQTPSNHSRRQAGTLRTRPPASPTTTPSTTKPER
ncbi:MFS transporter [Streptomyces sp. NPDC047081]|uniref:MFS transporter n=1 Tax=Streptomyces sp. NPDC047081 TaxID=3154706 RepID=UPI003403105B